MSLTMVEIAIELNALAPSYSIGQLSAIRHQLLGRKGSRRHKLFMRQTIMGEYAFHYGGRKELQFNVGYETVDGRAQFRHGVAFSLEQSRSLPDIEVLFPLIHRFNEFMRVNPEEYSDLAMWFWQDGKRSADLVPGQISQALHRNRTFIMLGTHYDPSELSYSRILSDFDRLLPLYEFVQGSAEFPSVTPTTSTPSFTPGNRPRRLGTTATRVGGEQTIELRHNLLQIQLHDELEREFGWEAVSSECRTGIGTRVDTVVRTDIDLVYYEIKLGSSVRSCVRQGLAQLLEYAYWPGAMTPSRLIIVGEPPLDDDARSYLALLRERFGLPIDYRQIIVG